MHRVELKVSSFFAWFLSNTSFLMHRVELKGRKNSLFNIVHVQEFLMHRVELKA